MYKPPCNYCMNLDESVVGLEKNLIKLGVEMNKEIITMGGYKANIIAPKLCKYSSKLMQISRSVHCLNQVIKEPRRVTEHTVEHTAIDLIFVNNPHRFVAHGDKTLVQTITQFFLLLKERELEKEKLKLENL